MPRLTNLLDYDYKKNMIFSAPRTENIPQAPNEKGKKAMTYQRILITTKSSNGPEDLIFKTAGKEHFSFGLQENVSPETGKVTGHSLPICLFNKDGPSKDELKWVEEFDGMMEYCKEQIIKVKDDLGFFDLEMRDLKKFNPLYWKKHKDGPNRGKIVEGSGPTFYAKTWEAKGEIKTIFHEQFFDKDNRKKTREIQDPTTLTGTYCTVEAAVKFESIYFGGGKCTPQIKLYHVVAKIASHGPRSILDVEEDNTPVEESEVNPLLNEGETNIHDSDGEKADEDGDKTEEEKAEEGESKPKVIKKVIRKKKITPA